MGEIMRLKMIVALPLLFLLQATLLAYDRDSDLLDASRSGKADAVKKLLKEGAHVDARKPDGRTALMESAFWDASKF